MRPTMMTSRFILACLCATAVVGCIRKDTAFTYHKDDISETQWVADQQTLRNTPGVMRVHGQRSDKGQATLEVGIKEGYDLLIQEKLVGLGWSQGKH